VTMMKAIGNSVNRHEKGFSILSWYDFFDMSFSFVIWACPPLLQLQAE
jgi:hypothetical protein